MANSAWSLRRAAACRTAAAHDTVRWQASRDQPPRVPGSATTWSSTMATSLPSASWISTARSGDKRQPAAVDVRTETRPPRR